MGNEHSRDDSFIKRSTVKYYFHHEDMDYYFQWILGMHTHGGSEVAECFYAASRITDGDVESWREEWSALARRVEQRAEASLKKGHRVSAQDGYLRACFYNRIPNIAMNPNDPVFRENWQRSRSCFRKAAELFDTPIEPIEIPFEGKQLPGYFMRVDASGEKRKTLIMIGGGETYVEDLYFFVGPAAIRRGYNVLMVDMPGQGGTPFDGLCFRADTETPMEAVVNFALDRPEVDPDRLAAYGISFGGYIVPRATVFEKRIKACIANAVISDVVKLFFARKSLGEDAFSEALKQVIAWRQGIAGEITMENLPEILNGMKEFKYDCAQITCPMLCMAGEGEAEEMINQTRQCFEVLPNPQKALHILTAEIGGEAHCQVTNLSLMNQVVFDWLDEVFE